MQAYHELLHQLLTRGKQRADRTGVGTLGLFGYQMRFDMSEGFPLMTTKRVSFKAIAHELLWFLKGDTNIRYLVQQGVNIWNEWPYQHWLQAQGLEAAYPKYSEAWQAKMQTFVDSVREDADFAAAWGELGPVYGRQWRNFAGIDQISQLINDIKTQPYSRRLIVTAWNPADIPMMIRSGLPSATGRSECGEFSILARSSSSLAPRRWRKSAAGREPANQPRAAPITTPTMRSRIASTAMIHQNENEART